MVSWQIVLFFRQSKVLILFNFSLIAAVGLEVLIEAGKQTVVPVAINREGNSTADFQNSS